MQKICKEIAGWPNTYFLPADPFDIMIKWETGDLCELEVINEIEEEFSIKITRQILKKLVGSEFKDVVEFIIEETS